MVIEVELHSRKSARVVTNDLFTVEGLDDYVELELVSYREGREVSEPTIYVRLQGDSDVVTVANKSEIAQCITNDGRKVSIFIGKPDERDMQPARVVLEP